MNYDYQFKYQLSSSKNRHLQTESVVEFRNGVKTKVILFVRNDATEITC